VLFRSRWGTKATYAIKRIQRHQMERSFVTCRQVRPGPFHRHKTRAARWTTDGDKKSAPKFEIPTAPHDLGCSWRAAWIGRNLLILERLHRAPQMARQRINLSIPFVAVNLTPSSGVGVLRSGQTGFVEPFS